MHAEAKISLTRFDKLYQAAFDVVLIRNKQDGVVMIEK